MGSENSTDSVSFASDMARRIRAGFGLIGRAFVVAMERLTGRPLSRVTKKRLAMSATRRSTFVWEIVRDKKTAEPELPEHFVRVEADVPETAPVMERRVCRGAAPGRAPDLSGRIMHTGSGPEHGGRPQDYRIHDRSGGRGSADAF